MKHYLALRMVRLKFLLALTLSIKYTQALGSGNENGTLVVRMSRLRNRILI